MEKEKKQNKICVIGTGYVGLVTGVCLAELGNEVICVDCDKDKIEKLKKKIMPIYEPGLKDLLEKNFQRLSFTTDPSEGIKNAEIIFIAVHTPTKETGETDLRYVESVSREIAKHLNGYKLIVSKSTMPVQTGQKIKETIKLYGPKNANFDVVSNPEFLREGRAVKDFLHPDRIVIGLESKRAEKIMKDLYKPLKAPIIVTNIETAEIIKHACNAFLATKISFINAIANICEKTGANVEEVAEAMGKDSRIGKEFLKAGIGYGGSCFPKDVDAFFYISKKQGYNFELLRVVQEINKKQREKFFLKIKEKLWSLERKRIGILGLSFKPHTDDMREAPSVYIIKKLLEEGAEVLAYDPKAIEKAKDIFGDKITYCFNPYDVAKNADALLILTDWPEFLKLDLKRIKNLLKLPKIFDGRNMFDPQKMKNLGFFYYSIGREKYEN